MNQRRSEYSTLAVTVLLFTHLMDILLSKMSVVMAVLVDIVMHMSFSLLLSCILINYILCVYGAFCRFYSVTVLMSAMVFMFIMPAMSMDRIYPLYPNRLSHSVKHKPNYISRHNSYNSFSGKNLDYSFCSNRII